jgi:hypothetical protein
MVARVKGRGLARSIPSTLLFVFLHLSVGHSHFAWRSFVLLCVGAGPFDSSHVLEQVFIDLKRCDAEVVSAITDGMYISNSIRQVPYRDIQNGCHGAWPGG